MPPIFNEFYMNLFSSIDLRQEVRDGVQGFYDAMDKSSKSCLANVHPNSNLAKQFFFIFFDLVSMAFVLPYLYYLA